MKRTVTLAALATLVFAFAQFEWPGQRGRLAGGWLGALGALVLLGLASRLRAGFPRPPQLPRQTPAWLRWLPALAARLRRRLQRAAPSRRVNDELARMEGVVVESLSSASGVHRRLRPLVRDIVEDELAVTSGLQLERDAGRVRVVVGEDLWELIRPDRPFPTDGFGPGMRLAELVALVEALEGLGEPR